MQAKSTCKSSPVKSVATAEHACPTSIPLHPIACLPALWACLPTDHSITWHACLICGHAYPLVTPSHGMLAWSVGMLTHWSLHHMACLPALWAYLPACFPIQHSPTWHTCLTCEHAYPSCPQACNHACHPLLSLPFFNWILTNTAVTCCCSWQSWANRGARANCACCVRCGCCSGSWGCLWNLGGNQVLDPCLLRLRESGRVRPFSILAGHHLWTAQEKQSRLLLYLPGRNGMACTSASLHTFCTSVHTAIMYPPTASH